MTRLKNDGQDNPSTVEIAAHLNLDIVREGIRQAKHSFSLSYRTFQLSLFMTAASGVIGLAGVTLLITGFTDKGTATAATGVTSSVVFAQLSKEAREQLERANARLDALRDELWDGELSTIFHPLLKEI
jgi:hypothetical protein